MPKILGYEFDLFKFLRSKEDEKLDMPVLNEPNDDGSKIFEVRKEDGAGVFFASGQSLNYNQTINNENDLIKRYRIMAIQPEVDEAVNDICIESIVIEDGNDVVSVNMDNTKWSKSLQKKISNEFENVLDLLEFRTKGFEIFKSWYIDGRIFYQKVPHKQRNKGLQSIKRLNSLNVKKVKEVHKEVDKKSGIDVIKSVSEYYMYSNTQDHSQNYNFSHTKNNTTASVKIPVDNIAYAHSGMYDGTKNFVISHLHKAIKPLNQLIMLEDSVVIYRISRAPERRIFYIDVGNLPRTKAEQYLQDVMRRFRNKLVYDSDTGDVRDDRKYSTMTEDYWLPRREGKSGTEISTLPGGQNLGEIEDVEYFKKKLYKALNVPTSRLEQETAFNMGRSGEITRDEVKFSKFIGRLRVRFSEIFFDILGTQLVMKGVLTKEEWEKNKQRIEFQFHNNSYFSELKEIEMKTERFRLAQEAESFVGEYLSRKWVKNNIFQMSDIEIEAMKKEIEAERNAGELDDDDFQDAGRFDGDSSSDYKKSPPKEKDDEEEPEDQNEEEVELITNEYIIERNNALRTSNLKKVSDILNK